jgi:hypothetical protein
MLDEPRSSKFRASLIPDPIQKQRPHPKKYKIIDFVPFIKNATNNPEIWQSSKGDRGRAAVIDRSKGEGAK